MVNVSRLCFAGAVYRSACVSAVKCMLLTTLYAVVRCVFLWLLLHFDLIYDSIPTTYTSPAHQSGVFLNSDSRTEWTELQWGCRNWWWGDSSSPFVPSLPSLPCRKAAPLNAARGSGDCCETPNAFLCIMNFKMKAVLSQR